MTLQTDTASSHRTTAKRRKQTKRELRAARRKRDAERAARIRAQIPPTFHDDQVLPLGIAWALAGVPDRSGRKLRRAGKGPRITWLSERRPGVRGRDYREWLDQLARGEE